MNVAGLRADPIHGGEMADRVALVAVQHELRFRGGARSEIEQERIGRPGRTVGVEFDRLGLALGEVAPSRRGTQRDLAVVAGKIGETIGQAAQDMRQGVRQAAKDAAAEAHKAVGSGGDTAPSPGQAGRAEGPGQAAGTGAGASTTSGRPSNPV